MIMQCACCQMNSVGMHECNCPMNPNNINQLPVVISGGYVPQDFVDKIANLQSQVTRLKELCGEIWVSIPDHVSYYDWCALKKRYEQRLKDEEIEIE